MRIELFKKLCMNFNKEPNEDLYLLFDEQFGEYDPYYFEQAIAYIIKNDNYFPTVARVLEVLKELPSEEIPTEEKKRRMKQMGVSPAWLDMVFEDETELDEEESEDFKNFLESFRRGNNK